MFRILCLAAGQLLEKDPGHLSRLALVGQLCKTEIIIVGLPFRSHFIFPTRTVTAASRCPMKVSVSQNQSVGEDSVVILLIR